ncbi:MAG TPA: carboxypeptidase-like regulatory domain-containing protein, partial [Gemmatimonadales bacterium]|nr:carboxypeptidase-like regulatory domain-containing protein [Gemmatimonadales bacterium]
MRTVARFARTASLAALALVFSASMLAAQATGKIEGRVRDNAGAPIANAQVFIVGTAFSALTNAQGYYFINNVPVGTVDMRAAFVGYRPVLVRGVLVRGGQTGTTDFALEASVVEVQAIEVTAERPLVPRDQVTSKPIVDGGMTDQLPADRINQVL